MRILIIASLFSLSGCASSLATLADHVCEQEEFEKIDIMVKANSKMEYGRCIDIKCNSSDESYCYE